MRRNGSRDQWLGVMLYEEAVAPRDDHGWSLEDGLHRRNRAAPADRVGVDQRQQLFAQEASTPINEASGLGNDIGSPHPGGASLVFCDGHVEFVAETHRSSRCSMRC